MNKIIACNWKNYLTPEEEVNLINGISDILIDYTLENRSRIESQMIILPGFLSLKTVIDIIEERDLNISVGGQNIDIFAKGAYTGAIIAESLYNIGCQYLLLGHSEVREFKLDNNSILIEKLKIALNHNLKVIFCIGESKEDYDNGNSYDIVKSQLETIIIDSKISLLITHENFIIAYEPVWAIGTSITPDLPIIDKMAEYIKEFVAMQNENLDNVRVLYGGSVSQKNISAICDLANIDGVLIGSASTKLAQLKGIIDVFI